LNDDAVIEAGLSHLRPVVLAAVTTVLGVAPLLQDVFWAGLGVTVMAGLTFGTILTMILVPMLYATLYGVRPAQTRINDNPSIDGRMFATLFRYVTGRATGSDIPRR
jgi:predicted RND superfamily exporter protein